jgi:hypothetical protein
MPRKKRDERLNLTVEETLKRQFEVVCAWKGVSMSEGAQQALAEWVQKNASPELLNALQNKPNDEPPPRLLLGAKQSTGKGVRRNEFHATGRSDRVVARAGGSCDSAAIWVPLLPQSRDIRGEGVIARCSNSLVASTVWQLRQTLIESGDELSVYWGWHHFGSTCRGEE